MSNCVSWQRKNKCYMICNPHPFVCCARLDCYTVLALWLWDCQWSRTVNRDMNLTTDWHHFLWSSKRHCHSPQTTYSSKSTCCVLSAQESAMRVVVYADRLTTLHSIVDIIMKLLANLVSHRTCRMLLGCSVASHEISSVSHTSVLPQHPRWKIVPYRIGWNHHTIDY